MRSVLGVLVAAVLSVTVPAAAQAPQVDTVWHSTVGTRYVSVINQWQTTPLRGSYAVRIVDDTGGASEIPLPNARGAVSEIARWNERLIVIVRRRAVVIDLGTATIVDEFLCDSPEMSADGRVMTYHPVSAAGDVQATVLTYEMGPR